MLYHVRPLALDDLLAVRSGAIVALTPDSPDVIEAELASSDVPLVPAPTLMMDGSPLRSLVAADPAATAQQLVGGTVWFDGADGRWTLIGVSPRSGWQVLDAMDCLDTADLVGRQPSATGWVEVMVAPIAGFWVILQADASGEEELVLLDTGDGILWGQQWMAWRAALRYLKTPPAP